MNYYQARQRESNKRWDFTKMNDGRIWPVGYCREWDETIPDGTSEGSAEMFRQSIEKHRPHQAKYHTDGHATAEGASECYKQYLLDNKARSFEDGGSQRKCDVCGEWTQHRVEINMTIFMLCETHDTREVLDKLFKAPKSIISSW